jgi:hypothetical protein
MTKNHILVVSLLLAVGVIAAWWYLRPDPVVAPSVAQTEPVLECKSSPIPENEAPQPLLKETPSPEVLQQKIEEGRRGQIAQMKEYSAAFNTPINFWGKVVDEKGNPVPGALAKMGAADQPLKTGTQYERTTDANGLFSVTGAKGLSLSVNVSKAGYYQTDRSRGHISYFYPSGNKVPLPTQNNPAVFEIRKMGDAVPLVVKGISKPISKAGTPIGINLESGKLVSDGQEDLKIQCWTNDQTKNAEGQYDWKCRISVPGGGLIERKDNFAFEAPADGYQPSDEIVMSQTAEKWNPQASRQYFVKLSDNLYARIEFEMVAGGDHFFSIKSYLNPTPGSRNLEYDPAKKVPVP